MERNNEDAGEELEALLILDDEEQGNSGVTVFLLLTIFVAISGPFAYGCAMGYSSPVESAIMEDLALTTSQYSLFGSLLTFGSMVGCLSSGKISDIIGRRGAMGVGDALSLVGWIIISISQQACSLYIGRFLVGASTGVIMYAVPIYVAEITPYNFRGALVSLTSVMICAGFLVMYLGGSLIPWRTLVIIGIIPSFVQLIGIIFISESPRFLAKRGQNATYTKVLQRLRGVDVDISKEAADIDELTEKIQNVVEVNFFGLLKRKYARALVVALGLMAFSGIGGPIAVLYYASSIFESAGFSSFAGSLVLAVLQLLAAIACTYFIDKCGRRPLLMISAGATCWCCFVVGFMFLLKENNILENISVYIIVVGLWGYTIAYSIGMTGIPFVIMSEIFAMNVKGSAGSLAIVVASGSGWITSYTFNFVTNWSYPGAFFILALINALATLFITKMVPETNGRTLEEIQESMKQRVVF